MKDKRKQRPECLTKLCWNKGKLDFIGNWESNDYCEYTMVECPHCLMKYWMIKRDGKYILKDRDSDTFEHRADRK